MAIKEFMKSLYNINGLMFWDEKSIKLREYVRDYFAKYIEDVLLQQNSAWRFINFEGPILLPRELVNTSYSEEDFYTTNDHLVLRPETTQSSYQYAQNLLTTHSKVKMPFCVWQSGKSFRREQDQVTKNMRLKEFYQQEFQCIFSNTTKNDYHESVLVPVKMMIESILKLPCRLVESDRLPSYSQKTMDVEVNNGDKWMEVCSISKRTDFPIENILVVEIAIGLDRILYNYNL